ncbi:AMP-binding protein [Pseudorhodoferax soli]|uniref:Fatty-acyl-CoA synthase/long-chain acyl-CoA synthetase n=1 Tax=Pseudorhodoferax soli TaxID=545864 RepID=A0A368XHS1_9BURK|nr:AMP-binding protein [Pseudorhodoferax soli]RCW67552.1 fatty-acyl-CoA synthase/long-chain acyl-CoA synthetase [Pseudorhodoferax soli]
MTQDEYLRDVAQLQQRHWPADIPRAPAYRFGEVPMTEYLRRWAALQPDKPAFIYYGAELSYRQLDQQSDALAALLARHGVRQGERVAVFLGNCPQFVVAFYAILKLGAVHVPVNPLFKEAELVYELNDTGAKVAIVQDQLMPLVQAVQDRAPLSTIFTTSFADALPAAPTIPVPESIRQPKIECPGTIDLLRALAEEPGACPAVQVGLDDVAALNYTGGTTGMPKGCVHTQRNMLYTAATTCTVGSPGSPDDISINFFPVFWIAGEDFALLFPVFSGGTCVLLARWDPVGFMAAVQRYRVNVAGLLVDNAVELLEHPEATRYALRSLQRVRVSSFVKKLNIDYRRRWQALTGTVMAEAAWGMTETHTCDTFTTGMQDEDFDLKAQPVFVGLPMPGTEFKICDFDSGALKPLDEEGEICCRSPSLLKGYWNKPEASAQALRDGWLHTGDIGVIDAMGYLHFLGRRKEMLKVKGMSVFPAEIEALLGQNPAILGSGVIGRADAERGQVPVAFIRVDPARRAEVDEQQLIAWCRRNMASYKVPEIRFVDALPMTATGKVKKEELAKLL